MDTIVMQEKHLMPHAKTDAKIDVLKFVDANSQPNERSFDSSSATQFFLPKSRTVQEPKPGVPRGQQRLRDLVIEEINRTQRGEE